MWRPKGWYKYSNEQPPSGSPNHESFEAGADAMLEALKKDWGSWSVADGTEKPVCPIEAVIPEEEK